MNNRHYLSVGILVIAPLLFLAFSPQTPPWPVFEDITAKSGIRFRTESSHTSRKYLPETMVGGVALFDYNLDGHLDIFFVNGAALDDPMKPGSRPDKHDPKYWNRLYRNNGDGTFSDVTVAAGLQGDGFGMGVAVGDYDNDGFPDLLVTSVGGSKLYHNNGDGTFTDVTASAGVAVTGWTVGAAFVDYDRDGLLDLFVSRYVGGDPWKEVFCGSALPGGRAYCHPDQYPPVSHLLFHNEGNGHFRDVSKESGISRFPGKGLGVAINDFDRDGWPDIIVANDSFPEQIFHNLKDGTFKEVALELGMAYDEDGNTFAGMGVDFADYNNDGWPDVFIDALSKQKYALFRNDCGRFAYVSGPAGIAGNTVAHSGWGAKFVDLDNDGWKDLFVGQGHVMDNIERTQPDSRYLEPPLLLRNVGGKFVDVSKQSGSDLQRNLAARGVAFGDLDNDGLQDIVIGCNTGPPVVLRNHGNDQHWLMVSLTGTRSNRDGIGAQIEIEAEDGSKQYAVVSTASSYLSASDKRVHFGLGQNRAVKQLIVIWPSGIVQRLENVRGDQILQVREAGKS